MAAVECGSDLAEMKWIQRQPEEAGLSTNTLHSRRDLAPHYVLSL